MACIINDCIMMAMLLWSCGGVNSTLGLGGGRPLHAVRSDYVMAVLASTGQSLAGVAARCSFRQGNGNLNSSVSSQTAAIPGSSTRIPQASDEPSFLIRIFF